MAQVAVRWLLQKEAVATVAVGARNATQLTESLHASSGWTLSPSQVKFYCTNVKEMDANKILHKTFLCHMSVKYLSKEDHMRFLREIHNLGSHVLNVLRRQKVSMFSLHTKLTNPFSRQCKSRNCPTSYCIRYPSYPLNNTC